MDSRRRLRLVIAATIVPVVAVAGGWLLSTSPDDVDARLTNPGTSQYPTIGTNATNEGQSFEFVAMRTLDGTTETTPGPRGRPMVVNFWFSTCEPCKREMPALSAAAAAHEGRIDFVGINPNDTPESAGAFLDRYTISYPNYLDDGDQLAAAGVATMPATFFLDESGRILERHAGELTDRDLAATLTRLWGGVTGTEGS